MECQSWPKSGTDQIVLNLFTLNPLIQLVSQSTETTIQFHLASMPKHNNYPKLPRILICTRIRRAAR